MHKESLAILILILGTSNGLLGEDPSKTDSLGGFSQLRQQQERDNFTQTAAWLAENTESPEYNDAAEWFLKRALTEGWYRETEPLCQQLLENSRTSESLLKRARWLRILALAARSETESALENYREELKKVRIRAPNETLELAYALSAQCQISNDPAAARETMRLTSGAFFLNEQVRTLCDRRLAKLLLFGQTAPAISWTTVFDEAGKLADWKGRYVLVDFWATNCAPCLVDLPHLKSVYARHQETPLEIIGLSLDRGGEPVRQFTKAESVRWPLALVDDATPQTREQYRVVTIPATFLLDPEGKIILIDGQARDVAILLDQRHQTAESERKDR